MITTKLTESSRDAQIMRRKIRKVKESLSDNARSAWKYDAIFTSHKLENFPTTYNWIKVKMKQTECMDLYIFDKFYECIDFYILYLTNYLTIL